MAEPASKAELLASLGRLTRGLSALFWGLPLALVLSVQTSLFSGFGLFGVLTQIGPCLAFGLLLYGLALLTPFQRQERIWVAAVERARLMALTNLGLAPFLYWHQRLPEQPFFATSTLLLTIGGAVFLVLLNAVLRRLAAMLPDETLRAETAAFTTMNAVLVILLPVLAAGWAAALEWRGLPTGVRLLLGLVEPVRPLILLFFALLPLAVTMSLLWKIKEAILGCAFTEQVCPAPLPSAAPRRAEAPAEPGAAGRRPLSASQLTD